MRRSATLSAHAKVNLFLDVTEKRSDGYHNILTVFQEIGLKDSLKIELRETPDIEVWSEPVIRDNIVEKAFQVLVKRAGLSRGFNVDLTKGIPMAAGLGGGSSDAAAFMKFVLDEGYANPPKDGWERLAVEVGSDVPFFLKGGCSLARGRGEILEPVRHRAILPLVVVWPGFPMATSERYARLDSRKFGAGGSRLEGLLEGLRSADLEKVSANLYNVFEERAYADYPGLKKLKRDMLDAGALNALMSGSGSSVFGIFKDPSSARSARERLSVVYKDVFTTKTI